MTDPFLKTIQSLTKSKVEFLVIGGFASMLYGVPRATFDLDLLVLPEEGNLKRLLSVLKKRGFKKALALSKTTKSVKHLGTISKLTPKTILQKWAVRFQGKELVDVLLYASTDLFSSLWKRRRLINVSRVPIPCPDVKDLIRLKQWSNRPQDQFDLEYLRKVTRPSSS